MPERLPERERAGTSRLAPDELVREVAACMARPGTGRSVLLVVALNRSDRLEALARYGADRTLLEKVGSRIEAVLRPPDRYSFVSREEAWVLLGDLPSESLAELASHALIESLSRPIEVDDRDTAVRLQPSIGGAWAAGASTPEPMTLLAAASAAAARSLGRENHVKIVRVNDDHDAGLRRHEVERDLHGALAANELDVHFQPQVDLRTGRCDSAEALIRWKRADGRMVNPSTIASICEERGLIGQLTLFTMNTALRYQAEWKKIGLDVSVAINLSAVTLSDTTLAGIVSQALDTWGVPGDRLTLELTESALVRNERVAIDLARQLRSIGCRLSIDDFGTGYSSLRYLHQFPLDELKIDRSFVRAVAEQSDDRRIVRALIDLAHAFGLRTVAEGVENAWTEAALRELDCDLAQGFHLSPAMPAERFAEWCALRNATAGLATAASREPR